MIKPWLFVPIFAAVCGFILGAPRQAESYGSHPPAAIKPAAEAPKPVPPQEAAPAAEEKAVEAYGASDLSCAEWTDGCVVCLKGASTPACSMRGIACEPKAIRCTSQSAPAPKP